MIAKLVLFSLVGSGTVDKTSYASPGRWVSERLSNTTASDNEQTSPNLSFSRPSRLALGLPRNYHDSYDGGDGELARQSDRNAVDDALQRQMAQIYNPGNSVCFVQMNRINPT